MSADIQTEKRLNDVEKIVLVMTNRLENQEKILDEIKNVLVE